MREFTPLAVIVGVLVGIVFGAANAYIGLKVGLTVSASIPAAVIAMAVLRGILRRGTILECNMVQTIGSVGESLAAGMIFVIPALFIFAAVPGQEGMAPSFLEMTIWGALGGVLGVLFMVPLRRMLVVKEHDKLPFPEGTACAEVLESGDTGGAAARTVFWGLGVGAVYELVRGLGFFADKAVQRLPVLKTDIALDGSPALLGVGYILGIRIAGFVLAGAFLGWLVIIPAIAFFGGSATEPIFPAEAPISELTPTDLWQYYVRYIGAGAVALGGLISLFRSLGTIGGSVLHMFSGSGTGERTDRDLPTWLLLLMLIGVGALMWYLPETGYVNPLLRNIPVIACVIGFGFFFVTVSSRLTGLVGGSSNPASGMTIATILGTALVVVMVAQQLNLDPTAQKVAILSVGALVCIAICIGGDTAQDLKTGYLVKATPWKQQMGELLGVLTATAALAGVVWLINDRYGFVESATHTEPVLAPQANIMKLLVEGIVDQKLPWNLILIGMASALLVQLLGLPVLPVAVGLYLPIYLSTPIFIGGVLRWIIDWRTKQSEAHNPGVLASSGLVAGHGVMGVMLVGVAALIGWWWQDPRYAPPEYQAEAQVWEYPAALAGPADPELPTDVGLMADPNVLADTNLPVDPNVPVDPNAPAMATKPQGQYVVPHHLFSYLAMKTDITDPEYGLRQRKYEGGEFVGQYAVDWYKLLPLGPFLLLVIWLAVVASRRLPKPPPDEGRDPFVPHDPRPDAQAAPSSAPPDTAPIPLDPEPLTPVARPTPKGSIFSQPDADKPSKPPGG